MTRQTRQELLAAAFIVFLLALASLLTSGCVAHRAPDHRPAPPPQVVATLDAFPPKTIAGNVVRLWARLKDPSFLIRCPSLTWLWPDGTRSAHESDCDPDVPVSEYVESKPIRVGHGDNSVTTIWQFQGREWRRSITVPAP